VVGRGPAAEALALRVLERSDDELSRLRGQVAPQLLVVLGDEDQLPWSDGVHYLGRDPRAPLLLLPTHLEPSVPADLFQQALVAARGDLATPLAVLTDPPGLVGTGIARGIHRAALESWLNSASPAEGNSP